VDGSHMAGDEMQASFLVNIGVVVGAVVGDSI
jgi:hypothetical protein